MADVYKQSFKQNYTNNIELSIFNCGLERCAPGQTWGPGIRDHYLIHLVVSGKGVFEVGGRTYEVVPGKGLRCGRLRCLHGQRCAAGLGTVQLSSL